MASRILLPNSRTMRGRGLGNFVHGGQSRIRFYEKTKRMASSSRRPLPRGPDAALTTIQFEDYRNEYQQQQQNHVNNFISSRATTSSSVPSPYDDLSALLPPWLMAKIPKGFENFFPKQKEGDADASESSAESSKLGETTTNETNNVDSSNLHPKQAIFKAKDNDEKKDDKKKRQKRGKALKVLLIIIPQHPSLLPILVHS